MDFSKIIIQKRKEKLHLFPINLSASNSFPRSLLSSSAWVAASILFPMRIILFVLGLTDTTFLDSHTLSIRRQSVVTPNTSESFTILESSGSPLPCSHLLTALSVITSFSASCACVQPLSRLNVDILLPISILCSPFQPYRTVFPVQFFILSISLLKISVNILSVYFTHINQGFSHVTLRLEYHKTIRFVEFNIITLNTTQKNVDSAKGKCRTRLSKASKNLLLYKL